jgi:hypothetical protein
MKVWKGLIIGSFSTLIFASSQTPLQSLVYETLWEPMFHGERLSACNQSLSQCGKPIANAYCCLMGYEGVKNFKIAPNLGITRTLSGPYECQGWMCSGFSWIKCYGHRRYHSRPLSDYKKKLFTRPHWKHLPLSWCSDNRQKSCGHRSAYQFCRWQGFSGVSTYSKSKNVPASRSIATNAICIQNHCRGFEYIVCQR